MTEQTRKRDEQERIQRGQSAARGDTGDGRTGVPDGEQGISNRAGDADVVANDGAPEPEDEAQDDDAADDGEPR